MNTATCHQYAKDNNGIYLGALTEFKSPRYMWTCEENHVWYTETFPKEWCPTCAQTTIPGAVVVEVAAPPPLVDTKEVDESNTVTHGGRKFNKPNLPEDHKLTPVIREVEQIRKYLCVTESYEDMTSMLNWVCGNGHEFVASLHMIVSGTSCRKCRKK